MPLHNLVGDVGDLWDDLSGLFGGRSIQQIRAEEIASMSSNKTGFFNKYGIILPDSIVIGILRPGWDAGNNGTQLFQRMINFYEANKTELENIKNSIGGNLTGGGGNGTFGDGRNFTGGGLTGDPVGILGIDFTSPVVLILIGVIAFVIFRK